MVAYSTADEYNLEGLQQGFKELGLYDRSSNHLARGGSSNLQGHPTLQTVTSIGGVHGFRNTEPNIHQSLHQHSEEDGTILEMAPSCFGM